MTAALSRLREWEMVQLNLWFQLDPRYAGAPGMLAQAVERMRVAREGRDPSTVLRPANYCTNCGGFGYSVSYHKQSNAPDYILKTLCRECCGRGYHV